MHGQTKPSVKDSGRGKGRMAEENRSRKKHCFLSLVWRLVIARHAKMVGGGEKSKALPDRGGELRRAVPLSTARTKRNIDAPDEFEEL